MSPIDTTIHSSRTDEDCDLPWRQSDDQQFGTPIKLPCTDEDCDFPWRQSCAQQLDFSSVNSPLHTAPYVNPHLNEVQSHQPLYFSFVHNDGWVALKLYLLNAPYKGTHKFFYEGEHDVYIQQAESYSHLVLDDLVLFLLFYTLKGTLKLRILSDRCYLRLQYLLFYMLMQLLNFIWPLT
ncbi:hypothetical protein P9112_003544 [Eukaryota sp. TZLM1-RC]